MTLCRLSLLAFASIVMILANIASGSIFIGSGHDKFDHALAFATLTPLAACAFPRAGIVAVFLGLMAFNAGIEVSQAFLGLGRQPDVADWTVGVLATLPVLGVIGVARFIRARPIKG